MAKKSFEDISLEISQTLEKKNKAYGNSFNKTTEHLKLLFPDGVVDDQYQHLMYIVRILDKIGRIANSSLLPPEEGVLDAYKDIQGYTTLMLKMLYDNMHEESNREKTDSERQEVTIVEESSK
jgi:hypothetical protein